mmetsp:Transcript_38643/g.89773  ORF Transcript_38643/g.89773 Transcript_38643/m.89773 type:complete len:101 (+) Transcript_38643:1699-2001(+)
MHHSFYFHTLLHAQPFPYFYLPYKQFGYGWNAATSVYCDLFEAGVIDPAKVTINAIENSASVAGLVLTTECLVCEIPVTLTEEQKQAQFDSAGMNTGIDM